MSDFQKGDVVWFKGSVSEVVAIGQMGMVRLFGMADWVNSDAIDGWDFCAGDLVLRLHDEVVYTFLEKPTGFDGWALIYDGNTYPADPSPPVPELAETDSLRPYRAPIDCNAKADPEKLQEFADRAGVSVSQSPVWVLSGEDDETITISPYYRQYSQTPDLRNIARTLMAELANNSATIEDSGTIDMIAGFVSDTDRYMAETATQCLLLCCGSQGELKLWAVATESVPHFASIVGIAELCGHKRPWWAEHE